jgi:hypothetical protein
MRRKAIFRLPAPSMSTIQAISSVCYSHWAAAKRGSSLPWWMAHPSWLTLDFTAAAQARPATIYSTRND